MYNKVKSNKKGELKMNQNEPLKPKTKAADFYPLTGFTVYKVEEVPGDGVYFTFRNNRGVECEMLYTGRELCLTEPYGIDSAGNRTT